MGKALLFINGKPPIHLPSLQDYQLIACTDGAFHYLESKNFPLEQLDFVSGDFDSYAETPNIIHSEKFIHTPDQENTDFHKALEILIKKDATEVDVYGGSGGEQDHYLGNLNTAYRFFNKVKITFYDEYSRYFFIPNFYQECGVLGKTISLVPFPIAQNITTTGLHWPINQEDLDITTRIGTRNIADGNCFTCRYEKGALLVFISHKRNINFDKVNFQN
ncbi:thiamine diphosphokinase [Elizabethkingia sp. JS20170427COW]|uniref:thiamine diphosphokinase n=1 Tax=Elizabethkingia sp. JS20170427COW TaxID=2583851 RepID=UPI00111094F4|nr:thiamine diphosphokinase [Elizabethkingia sp. JS20170427COW]QCX52669.1 thiamine diphosphokinase [Elizabethkingia sp. JS20170427COW]